MPFKTLNEDEVELLSAYRTMTIQAAAALLGAGKMYAENFPRRDVRNEEAKIGEVSLALLALEKSKTKSLVALQ